MANQPGRRRFGNVRQRASGRWQARYIGPDGLERTAPHTFATERQAQKWLTLIESDIIKGEWAPPEAGEIVLADYGVRWISERKLAPRTRQGYEYLFALHVRPHLGQLTLAAIKPATIRAWRKTLLDRGCPEPQAVKAYTLLRAILNTAVKEDEIIRQNPCRIKGYDRYHTPERPTATIPQVFALADAMPARFSALVIVGAFSSLRWGELAELRRKDVDLETGIVRVSRKLAILVGRVEVGPPKSASGVRVVALPEVAVEALRRHMGPGGYVNQGPDSLIFTGAKGAHLRGSTFGPAVKWRTTVVEVGLPEGFHFHDLRHTGNTLAASSGASTRELMTRMGHATMRAALIYQHATSERDREIADRMNRRITKPTAKQASDEEGEPDGPARATPAT
ncbi:site-specific recombinase XerD [Krasilnikovia cinnamomea]|uniref:Site-specific recombinase XerD n=1 Tax=Krasilnikovia cinnamomea TaxID=349313 RepID=A0A4Q7ZQ24_9ACTN|nr:site-specific integrase [Krasilnikovia cinnamomea]RZU52535.1 site-specific recombinase XerD [Krasilnikovia cinnamomea]